MEEKLITAEERKELGKNVARRLRRNGRIPAIIYGENKKPIPIAIDPKPVLPLIRSGKGESTILRLKIGKKKEEKVIIKDYQVDPIRDTLAHVDFLRISMTKRIRVHIPIVLTGEAKGVKEEGGIVEFLLREVEIECLPGDIPDHIELDITELRTGDSLHISDITPPEKVEIVSDPTLTVVHIGAPAKVAAEAVEVTEEAEEAVEEEKKEVEEKVEEKEEEGEKE
ncbi:MAG: 50S ribosomal protein L25/general stress protein Ctc [Acidobacteria bacterium]|nr:50S ribosomal protein L25/general stress protein Ctc [Acidobacteriota bacterium]